VVPQVEEEALALGVEALEPGELPAGGREVLQQVLGKGVGADAVEEQADDDAAPGGLDQDPEELEAVSSPFQM